MINPLEFIATKRDGKVHSHDALRQFVMSYVRGEIPDYQAAAWLMAVYLNGMNDEETTALTQVMAESGDMLDLSDLPNTVDKHSTGGVGDKTSLVLAPLLASCGATVAKMSGRGLGHTGGTVDKLEAIPGFQVALDEAQFRKQAREVGVVITGQSKQLAPADGLLYALRDATATVASVPLIASSIMSKKLAGGARTIVLDVKVGEGAFMKTTAAARELAAAMMAIGQRSGRTVSAVLSNMHEPLGYAVGNALEVAEAVRTLQGQGPDDLTELCLTLAEVLLHSARLNSDAAMLRDKLTGGDAYAVFERWIAAQGGDISKLSALELSAETVQLAAPYDGYISTLDALNVGEAVKLLGGGRLQKSDAINLGVGVVLHNKIGDAVRQGEPLATIYHRNRRGLETAQSLLRAAIKLSPTPVAKAPLIVEIMR
jgi:pyrimidine-nucleoside phosphorylase/thymidine phosphorylase